MGLSWLLPLCGAFIGAGVALVMLVATQEEAAPPPIPATRASAMRDGGRHPLVMRAAASVAAGLVLVAVTRWVVGGLAAAALVWVAPAVFGAERRQRRDLEAMEAMATWVEQMRDTLRAMAGLETAIARTAPRAPLPIRRAVQLLAAELQTAEALDSALLRFAARVGNEVGDRVVAGLRMQRGSATLGEVLSAIARQTRAQVDTRRRNEVEQRRLRRSARWIMAVSAATVLVVAVADRGFLSPYDTAAGQLVLAVVLLVWGAGYWSLTQLSAPPAGVRLFSEGR